MGKCMNLLLVLVFLNGLICFLFLTSEKLLLISADTSSAPEVEPSLQELTNNITNATTTKLQEKKQRTNSLLLSTNPVYLFEYVINPADLCQPIAGVSRKLVLLVLVHSAPANSPERLAIRQTWGSLATLKDNRGPVVRIAFLLGATTNEMTKVAVQQESETYHDIVQADFIDSYQNLTLKSIMMLKWVSEYCADKALFLLKTDDDMYVNLQNLFKIMSKLSTAKNAMFGVLFRKAVPYRNPTAKWFVPKSQFPGKVFPDYLSGTAYIMTMDVVPKLYQTSLTKPFVLMEDVFITGICASAAGIKRFQINGFSHLKRLPRGCAFRDIVTGHHVTVKQMKRIWQELAHKTNMAQCPSAAKTHFKKKS